MQDPQDTSNDRPNESSKITRRTLLAALPGLLLLPGCAKGPSSGITSPASGPQLLVTMTVAGTINPSLYYFVLFNLNNVPSQTLTGGTSSGPTGPVPVVAPPYGNGFAAGAFVRYVIYTGGQIGYNAIDPTLFTPQPLGAGNLIQSSVSGSTLSFQLPLANLATSTITVDQIQTLQLNFITTNTIQVVGDNFSTPKYFDALYTPDQSGSNFVNIFVRNTAGGPVQQLSYQNRDRNIEGSGDVAQNINGVSVLVSGTQNGVPIADLDITDFTIQLNP